ncbi:hypothetical protein [Paractinoplanes rishiriensis]|uniref:hypothetical protein n=1 Tax=Paractinoplanes rishiriensis TaxID=1050105 RepID=UPI001944316F|nr:hypothetical protein [Actinoplanes rishiriensis]
MQVRLANPQTFGAVAVQLGVPFGASTHNPAVQQFVVVRVQWSGNPRQSDSLQLLVLDGRLTPPRPLAADAGWNSAGKTGSLWSTAYESLAEHYDWLAGVAAANYTDTAGRSRLPAAAVHAGTGHAGTVTGWYWQWGDDPIDFSDPHEVIVALVDVDDAGEIRWARRISG